MGTYKRLIHFRFSIPTPIGGVAKTLIASEFSDQEYNRNHKLAASAVAGMFTLTFLTKGNVDETAGKISLKSNNITSYNGNAGVTAGWELVMGSTAAIPAPYPDSLWTYQATNTENFVYLVTVPLVLFNSALTASDVPATGAIFDMDIEVQLMGMASSTPA